MLALFPKSETLLPTPPASFVVAFFIVAMTNLLTVILLAFRTVSLVTFVATLTITVICTPSTETRNQPKF